MVECNLWESFSMVKIVWSIMQGGGKVLVWITIHEVSQWMRLEVYLYENMEYENPKENVSFIEVGPRHPVG